MSKCLLMSLFILLSLHLFPSLYAEGYVSEIINNLEYDLYVNMNSRYGYIDKYKRTQSFSLSDKMNFQHSTKSIGGVYNKTRAMFDGLLIPRGGSVFSTENSHSICIGFNRGNSLPVGWFIRGYKRKIGRDSNRVTRKRHASDNIIMIYQNKDGFLEIQTFGIKFYNIELPDGSCVPQYDLNHCKFVHKTQIKIIDGDTYSIELSKFNFHYLEVAIRKNNIVSSR